MSMQSKKPTLVSWFKSGDPWVWMNAAAVSISVIAVVGLLAVLAVNGFGHFWSKDIKQANYFVEGMDAPVIVTGEVVDVIDVPSAQLISAGFTLDKNVDTYERQLIKLGNRDVSGADFGWFLSKGFSQIQYPKELMVLERREWGNFYGRLVAVKEGETVSSAVDIMEQNYDQVWDDFEHRLARALRIHDEIYSIEKHAIGKINHGMERLRLKQRKMELDNPSAAERAVVMADITSEAKVLDAQYAELESQLAQLYNAINRDSLIAKVGNGEELIIPLAKIVRANRPNAMTLTEKVFEYFSKMWEFLSDDPREANTEGGIFPAIFGTVLMVLLMTVIVSPLGVVAAIYLHEYAGNNALTKLLRIAVINLAGVPSIVYGVFGLGFFVYMVGGSLDQLFYPETLPSPTFGTPGVMWSAITLAILTLPVVIVSTEEGLARIPSAMRHGSLALGATKAETLWRIILPIASPAIMTGIILAIARAAGEVAPLMLVGVVKMAPNLPLDGNFPFLHLDRKFMHLGFHIYDVGFQSPNVEAARPLVYATALLLVTIIVSLNMTAVAIRNRLREKYRMLEH